jgi:hypothetical protein
MSKNADEHRIVPPLPQAGPRWWPALAAYPKAPLTLGQGHRPEHALGDQAARQAQPRVLPQMVPDTQLHAASAAGAHHRHGIIQGRGHGLLAEDVLAGLRYLQRMRRV